jgi:hypothetical protein
MILLRHATIINHRNSIPFKPKKRLLPVTAIAGFLCHDGVVISAETEETYEGGGDKAYTHKIFPHERDNCRLVVAGSGSAYLIDYANAELAAIIEESKGSADFGSKLRTILDRLYSSEFKTFPVNHPSELLIQLLVGAQFRINSEWEEPVLFECRANLVTAVKAHKPSCMLGAGELLKEKASQLANWGLSVQLAEWASVYLIHEAKHRFGGVGGNIHSFTIKRDGRLSYKRGFTEQESVIEVYNAVQHLLLLSLDVSLTDEKANDLIKSAITWMKDARRHLKAVERNKGKKRHMYVELRNTQIEKMVRHIQSKMKLAARMSKESEAMGREDSQS